MDLFSGRHWPIAVRDDRCFLDNALGGRRSRAYLQPIIEILMEDDEGNQQGSSLAAQSGRTGCFGHYTRNVDWVAMAWMAAGFFRGYPFGG